MKLTPAQRLVVNSMRDGATLHHVWPIRGASYWLLETNSRREKVTASASKLMVLGVIERAGDPGFRVPYVLADAWKESEEA